MHTHTHTHSHRYAPIPMRARRLPNKDCTPNNAAQKVQTPDKDAPKCKGSQRTNEATTQLQGRRIRGFKGVHGGWTRDQGRAGEGPPAWPGTRSRRRTGDVARKGIEHTERNLVPLLNYQQYKKNFFFIIWFLYYPSLNVSPICCAL